MANVKPTKILVAFSYKGVDYEPGDEPPSIDAKYAARLEKLDYIKLDKEASEKVEKAAAVPEKNSKAGPNGKK
jgi:hypothetical protein